jgi:hypothetical protein
MKMFAIFAFAVLLIAPAQAADYDSYKDWKAPVPINAPAPSRAVYVVVVDWLGNEEFEMRVDKLVIERFNLKAGDRVSTTQAFKLREAEDELEAMKLR